MAMLPEVAAYVQVIQAVHEAVVANGLDGIPSGAIYAHLMVQGCTLEQYEKIEKLLIESKLVRKQGDVLFAMTLGAK